MERSDLFKLMQEPLPTIGQQKRFAHRTTVEEVTGLYHLINALVFDSKLIRPEIEVKSRCRQYWGMCYGEVHDDDNLRPFCKIRMMQRWYAKQWVIVILAHEMCHQYQWMNLAPERVAKKQDLIMSHGPSFFLFRDNFSRLHIYILTSIVDA